MPAVTGKTERFPTEKGNRKITQKGTTGRSGEDVDFEKNSIEGLLYPSE